ncbi:unnamed protein product [Sphagnum troendelagicum]|uniref:Uncharacterized protein n=1 Tax=Sphagnum troendelagicum TaxID=128251 RepID=A0ABP0V366_9BRYO
MTSAGRALPNYRTREMLYVHSGLEKQQCSAFVQDIQLIPREAQVFSICSTDAAAAARDELLPVTTTIADQRAGGAAAAAVWICVAQQTHGPTMDKGNDAGPLLLSTPTVQQHTHVVKTQQDQQVRPTNTTTRSVPVQEMQPEINGPSEEAPHKFMPFTIRGFVSSVREADLRQTWPFTEALLRWRTQCRGDQPGILPPLHSDSNSSSSSFSSVLRSTTFFKLRTSSSIYSIPESACLRSDDDAADLVANYSIPHTVAASEEVITTRDHKSPDSFYGAAARNLKDQQQQLAAEIQTDTFLKLRGSGSSQEQVVEEEAAASGTALGKVPARSVRRSCAAVATTVVCGKPLVAADSYSASAMRLRGHGRGSVVAATVVAGIRSSSSVAEAAASVATNRVTLLQDAPELVHEGAAAAPNLHGMEQQLVCKAEHLVGSSGNRADGIEKLRAICGDQDGVQSSGGDRHEDQRDHLTVEVNQASLQVVPVDTINNHDDDSRRDRTREEATPPGVVVDSTAARERGLEASTAGLDSGVVAEEVPPAAIVVDDQSRLFSLKHSESSGVAHGPKKSLAADHGPRSIQSPAAAAAAPHESVRIAIDKSSAQMMRSLSLQQGSSAAETTTARSAGQLAGPAAVASTTVPGTSMGSGEELGSCPVCRVFTSSSNTALNVHIDQCLVNTPSAAANSMDDNDRLHPTQSLQQAAAAHGSRAAQPKFKVKTQKKRSLAVLCAFAPRRDLEAEEESGHESGRSASRESSPAEGAASEPVQRESGIRRQPRTAFALRGAASAAAAAPKKSVRTGSTVEASTDRSIGFIGISNPGNQCRPPAAKQQHRRLSSDSAKLPNQQPGESGKRPLSDCIEQRAAESEIQTKRKRRKLPSGKQQPANSIIPAGNVCTDSKKSSTSSSAELMPGLDSQLQKKNSIAGSEAAGSGQDQEVAPVTSFPAEVLPISSSKRSNKIQAKLELCNSNEKVDDSCRSSSRPAKPVVKGKRNLQEPEEVNDGSQVQVAAMEVVDQLLATRPTKLSEPGAATTDELLNGKEMPGVLGMHITSGLHNFSGKKQLQAAAPPAAASGTTLVSESMSLQQQQKKAASLSSKAASKQGEPDHKMEQQQQEQQQQQKTTHGITSLELLPARKKNKVVHGGGESLSVFQKSSMRPPPPAAGLASKTCDSPRPPPHPARKEKLKRKRPFQGYTKKEAPHLMSRSNAILREVLGLKQHFGEATNIGSCLTTNLQSELNSEAAGSKALSLQLPDIVTSSANITTAASQKRVLENVCNDDDDDAAAKDLLQEVDRGGAHVALESPANLESQCCSTAGVLQESSEVEGQKLLGESEQTQEDHHAHQGRKSNLDIIGESQQKQEEDHHAHQGKKSNLDIIGESQQKQEEDHHAHQGKKSNLDIIGESQQKQVDDHHAHQGKKSNLDIIGESQQTREDCHAHQGKKNLNIIGDLQGAGHIAVMQTHEEDSSLKPAVDSSSCCRRHHMQTQKASKRKTSVKDAAGEPPPARKTIGLPARGPGGRFISTKSLKKSRDDSPNAAAVAASSNKIIALESEVLDLPAASSGIPAASTGIQNSISVLDLPAASSGVPAASTSIQNSISDRECPATTDHHQNSADEILQSDVVVDVVPETTISDSADGEKNTRFLSGGVGGSSSIEPIIEEAHDQAASDVYPLVVHQKETISPSPVCVSKSAPTTDAFCKGSSSTLANTPGVIGVKAGNNNSSSNSSNPVVVVVVPLDQQLQTSESKKLSPNSDVVEVVSEGEEDDDEDDARVTKLPRWMLAAMMEQQHQATAQDTSQEQKHQASKVDLQMRGQERSTVASVSHPCTCDHEQEGLIINSHGDDGQVINSHGSDRDPSSMVRLFGNPVLRLMGRNVLVPKESDLNVGVMVGQKQQQFADFSQQLLLSDHENLKGQETVDTLTGVGIATNVLESSDPADVEETINGSVPVARSLEGNPVCNDHDRALSDTATTAKVVVLWQAGDANQHVKLGSSECILDLQLQHSWNVTASRKARGFAHNAEEWQAENSLEGGRLDHATTDLGSSSMSRPHGDQPRGIGVTTWKTKGFKSRQPPSPGAHEVIVIDDLQPLSTTDPPPEEANPLRRHDQELLAIEALMKAGALRQLPPELDEQASNLAPGARGPVMELDCSRITQLSGIHQNHDLFVELRKLGLVPAMHVNPQQSLDFTSVPLHEDLCDTIGDHRSMSNHKAIAQVPNPHRQCTATTAVTPCGLSESSCPTKAGPLPAKLSPSGGAGGGSAQHLLPPWLLAAKKQTAAQMATNLIVLDDDDDNDDDDTTVDEPPAPSRAWKRFPRVQQGGSSATCSTSTSGSCRAPRMAHVQCHSATPPLPVAARSIAAPVTKLRSLQAVGAPPSQSLLLQNSSVLRQAGGLKAASSSHGVNLGFLSLGLEGDISISGTMMPSLRSNERWNWQESPSIVDIVSPEDSPACRDHLDTTSARILGRSLEAPVAFLDATHSSNSQLETLRLLDCLDFEQPMRDTGMHVATKKASTHEPATTGRSSLTTAQTRWQDVPAQGTSADDFRHHEADSSCTAPLESCSIHIQQQPISQWHQSSTAAALSAGTSSTTLAFQSAGSFKLPDQATRAPSSSSMRLTMDQAPSPPDEASSMGWSLLLHRPEANCTRALMSGNDNIVSFSNTTTIKEQIASPSGHVKQQQQQPPHLSANCSNTNMIPDLMTMTPLGKQVARNAFYREKQLLLPMDSSSAQPNAAASMKTGGNFNSGICQTNV